MNTQKQRLLPCALTDAEVMAKAGELSERVTNLEDLKLKKKQAGAQFNTAIKDEEGLIRGLSKAIHNREEQRQVDIDFRADVEKWEMVVVRLDTGEEVDRRAMTSEERQKHGQVEMELDAGISDPEDAYADTDGDEAEEAKAEQEALDAEDDKPRTRVRKGKAAPVEETVEPAEAH